jgi:cell division protease FtsH
MKKTDFSGKGKKPDIEINRPAGQRFWQTPGGMFLLYALFMLGMLLVWQWSAEEAREEIPYSQFLKYVEEKKVQEALVTDKLIVGTLEETDPKTGKPRRFVTVPLFDEDLARFLEKNGVTYRVRHGDNWLTNLITNWVIPIAIFVLVWMWLSKRMAAGRGFLNIGANRVHIHPETGPKVTFDDVAGAESAKQELKEVIDFLKDPTRIQKLGGRMPKGVLVVGPPGTGKTLLARAVSGEANVPFFNISGSEFIEMFVGVGAARVRELFQQAREKAPCIIFIDELDAIGRARGVGPVMGGHDEREQTLNQLLVELDGFDPSSGVAVMAATNRPEILDKALLRAGRFDRQIVVDKPDLEERILILKLHASKLKLADDVDLRVVAQRTPGFVGADLANIANEAAIHALRYNQNTITMADFEAAIDRVIAGPEKKHRVLGPEEKHQVAYHESGHALVAVTVPTGEPVHKVSIIPRGVAALGYTLQLPVKEKFLSTGQELKDQIAILLGGRVAEEVACGDISSGAQNDLERASEIARQMVCHLGMNKKLGPLTYGKTQQSMFLGVEGPEERNYSEETSRLIDAEVRALVEEGHLRATRILTDKRPVLDALAQRLEQEEVISGEQVDEIIRNMGSDSRHETVARRTP